ncbi:MAG: hypothetical protein OEZ65_13895 [Gemmatimonadota bacterium]|nr:hypothetical protein [Gemmatimonadota bacterium]MDH5760676.1 hypothetical protein [Gemmatimonadota bacterium]
MPSGMLIWPDNPGLSALTWVLLAVVAMYAARAPAHRAIRGFTRVISRSARLLSHSMMQLQGRMSERSREILLQHGMENSDRQIQREFERISTSVSRDLGSYPSLHRKLSDHVTKLDEDYRKSTDTPPDPPGWASALEMANQLVDKAEGDKSVGKAIQALHKGFQEAYDTTMSTYRQQSQERHGMLKRMRPVWKNVDETLIKVDGTVTGILERGQHIDQMMDTYREISGKTDRAERLLGSSALTQFLISGLVLAIACLGGFINFQLIALPMSEMVGATSQLGGMKTSAVAALVIIMVEITMGLFLMESLRITRLFPIIGSMDERTRKRMMWATFGILLTLASIESSLAYMRDLLAADRASLSQVLSGIQASEPEFRWIPAVGQMVMGFILPFALTFVAIPLESFVHSARVVLSHAVEGILRLVAFLFRLIGSLVRYLGDGLVNVYDIVIFLPLKVEELILSGRAVKTATKNADAAAG